MASVPPKPVRIIRRRVSPLTITNQYLYHEFLKIFWDAKDKVFRQKMKRSLYRMYRRDGTHTYWLLVAAISEGWRLKWVYRLLSDPGYQWNLETRNINDLTMTGFSPPIVDRLVNRCQYNFYTFADYYRKHPEFFKKYMPNLKPRPERDHQPIFVYWEPKEKRLKLFDGMRRTVLAAINRKKTIRAYVGYPVRKGKPMVNLDKLQYFHLLFRGARKDRATYRAFLRLGREIVRQSSNGRRDFQNWLKPWAGKQEKKLINEIIKK